MRFRATAHILPGSRTATLQAAWGWGGTDFFVFTVEALRQVPESGSPLACSRMDTWGYAKLARVFPTELGGTCISNLQSCPRHRIPFGRDEPSCFEKSHRLLVLKGRGASDRFEMPMERRLAHPDSSGELGH